MAIKSKGGELRKLMKKGIVTLPGVYNAVTAMLAEQEDFKAAYVSGAGVTNAMTGFPDIGLLTLTEMAAQVRYMAAAVKLPLICDADTGYGEIFNVRRCVNELEEAGAAGIHLEDQENPKRCGHLSGKKIVPADTMQKKIRAAVQARQDKNFIIIARTDARGVYGVGEAVRRAKLYKAAGADVIFPEALESVKEFKDFSKSLVGTPLLANMTEFGKSPLLNVKELEAMGYQLVIFPMTAFRVMMKSAERLFKELRHTGSQKTLLYSMQTRKELYALLGYDEYMNMDKKYK